MNTDRKWNGILIEEEYDMPKGIYRIITLERRKRMFNQKQKAEVITLIPERIQNKQSVAVEYVKLFCVSCGASWGISVKNSQISEKDCLCKNCLIEKSFS